MRCAEDLNQNVTQEQIDSMIEMGDIGMKKGGVDRAEDLLLLERDLLGSCYWRALAQATPLAHHATPLVMRRHIGRSAREHEVAGVGRQIVKLTATILLGGLQAGASSAWHTACSYFIHERHPHFFMRGDRPNSWAVTAIV